MCAVIAAALLREDRNGKCVFDAKSQAAAALPAPSLCRGLAAERVTAAIETSVYYVDPQAGLETADITCQFA